MLRGTIQCYFRPLFEEWMALVSTYREGKEYRRIRSNWWDT